MASITLLRPRESFVLLGVYQKGKRGKDLRYLLKDKSGELHILYFEDDQLQGADWVLSPGIKEIVTNKHYKLKNYNYYYLNTNYALLEQELDHYKNNCKYFPQANGMFSPKYNPVFEFNGRKY